MVDLMMSGALIFLLDQVSKRVAIARSAALHSVPPPFVRIRSIATRHPHFASGGSRMFLVILWSAALISSILLETSGNVFADRAAVIGIGAALGGAAGNLLDVFRAGAVTDFIDFRWWPAFNLADVAIVGGLALGFIPR